MIMEMVNINQEVQYIKAKHISDIHEICLIYQRGKNAALNQFCYCKYIKNDPVVVKALAQSFDGYFINRYYDEIHNDVSIFKYIQNSIKNDPWTRTCKDLYDDPKFGYGPRW